MKFRALCNEHDVPPAVACIQFALSPPGVVSIALNTSQPDHVSRNVESIQTSVPAEFWSAAKIAGLIDSEYPYVG